VDFRVFKHSSYPSTRPGHYTYAAPYSPICPESSDAGSRLLDSRL
jgi:hypothetical protein